MTVDSPARTAGSRHGSRGSAPGQFTRRIRLLFLLFSLFNVITAVPRTIASEHSSTAARVFGAVAALLLAAWWVLGYRRGRFPIWAVAGEAAAIGLIGRGLHDYVGTLGLLFGAVSFRGLYDTWRHVVALVVATFAGAAAAVLSTQPADFGGFAEQAIGVPALGAFTALVAAGLVRQERAAARERVFSEVGTALALAPEPDRICLLAAEAGLRMLADHPDAWAAVTRADEDGELTVARAGSAPVDVVVGAPMPAERDLGPQLSTGLGHERRHYGRLIVGGTRPVPPEVLESIHALAAQVTLGLVNAEVSADLRYQAFHDSLTGLSNRSLMREHLLRAMSQASRSMPVAVVLIDLDGFKQTNDVHGHAVGDLMLVAVGQRLREAVRGGDTAARLGGDEFAVVLAGMEQMSDAVLVATRILLAVEAPLEIPNGVIVPRASVGVADWRNQPTPDAFLHDADLAMYAAKSAGKSRVAHLNQRGELTVLRVEPERVDA